MDAQDIFHSEREFEIVAHWVISEAKVLHEKTENEEEIETATRLATRMGRAIDGKHFYEFDLTDAELEFIEEVVAWREEISAFLRTDDPDKYIEEYEIMSAVYERLN